MYYQSTIEQILDTGQHQELFFPFRTPNYQLLNSTCLKFLVQLYEIRKTFKTFR